MEIMQRMKKVFRMVFEDETLEINEKTCAEDIEDWDSLRHVILVASLADEFKIKFDIDEIVEMENVGDMLTVIKGKAE